jgi:hypothetical protein
MGSLGKSRLQLTHRLLKLCILHFQGSRDELGALNHITMDTIKTAKEEIKEGIAISMNLELEIPNPPINPLRPELIHGAFERASLSLWA